MGIVRSAGRGSSLRLFGLLLASSTTAWGQSSPSLVGQVSGDEVPRDEALNAETGASSNDAVPCGQTGPFVSLIFRGDGWAELLKKHVEAQLEAGFERHNLEVCRPQVPGRPSERKPHATIELRSNSPDLSEVLLVVADSASGRRNSRTLELDGYDGDGKLLALVVATEELLRATWAAAVSNQTAEQEDTKVLESAPDATTSTPAIEPTPSLPAPWTTSAEVSYEVFEVGQHFLGADLLLGHHSASLWQVETALGARIGLEPSVARGQLQVWSLSGRAAVGPEAQVGVWGLALLPGVRLHALQFNATSADAFAEARSASGIALVPELGLRARLQLDGFQLIARTGVGYAALGAQARAFQQVLAGVRGAGVNAALGIGFAP